MKDQRLTIREAMQIKQVSRQTIYDWMTRGVVNWEEYKGRKFVLDDDTFTSVTPQKPTAPTLKDKPSPQVEAILRRLDELDECKNLGDAHLVVEEMQKILDQQASQIAALETKLLRAGL